MHAPIYRSPCMLCTSHASTHLPKPVHAVHATCMHSFTQARACCARHMHAPIYPSPCMLCTSHACTHLLKPLHAAHSTLNGRGDGAPGLWGNPTGPRTQAPVSRALGPGAVLPGAQAPRAPRAPGGPRSPSGAPVGHSGPFEGPRYPGSGPGIFGATQVPLGAPGASGGPPGLPVPGAPEGPQRRGREGKEPEAS